MATVLVVQRERSSAERISAALRDAGYIVHQCCGPDAYHCPVLEGEPCDFVDEADALVYGLGLQPVGPDTDAVLLRLLRWTNPGAPLIVADDEWLAGGNVEQLAVRDRFVRILPAPFAPEQVVTSFAEALSSRLAVGVG